MEAFMKSKVVWSGLLLLTLTWCGFAQMSGSYTIDPNGSGSRNYPTFSAAAAALSAGVNGPVVFNVVSTTFQETVNLTPVTGASAQNTITFVASGVPAILDAGNAQDAVTMADLTDYIVLDNLKLINFTRYGLFLNGQSGSNKGVNQCQFQNLEIDGPITTSGSIRALYLTQSDSNTFFRCAFRGGGYTVYHSQCDKNVYDSCEFDGKGQATYAAYFINNNDSDNVIQNCFLHSIRNSTSSWALGMQASSHGNMVLNNVILCTTAGGAAKIGGLWMSYAVAESLKNNIIVNLGTGVGVDYRFWDQGTAPPNKVSCCVTDHNCYYLPNSPNTITVTELAGGQKRFQGNLTAWYAWQTQNPSLFIAGGPAQYDTGSFEADPGLVSMTAPHDIHLKANSPCLDMGTSQFVESYQSFNQNHQVTTDFEGDARGTRVDIGADEVAVTLVGSGSGQPGTSIQFSLFATADASLPYQMGSSFGNGPIPLGTRQIELSLDDLLVVSVKGLLPFIFQNYAGVLDAQGQASARLNIPGIPQLTGLRIYTAFVTVSASAPGGVQSISKSFLFTIQ
jgi:hypothetical protein